MKIPKVNNKTIIRKQKLSFIKKYSNAEWQLNGWINESPNQILNIFDIFKIFSNDGNYLELGCGSGLIAKYLCIFSGKLIIPYGIDVNRQAIEYAKINNPKFSQNFIYENYYDTLKEKPDNFKKYSTINIFVNTYQNHDWETLTKLLTPIVKKCPNTTFIIVDYDYCFFKIKDKKKQEFINQMNRISLVTIVCTSTMIIGKIMKFHLIAEKYKQNIIENSEYTNNLYCPGKILRGTVIKKSFSSISIVVKSELNQKTIMRFPLTPKQCYIEFSRSPKQKITSGRLISLKEINIDDQVSITYGTDNVNTFVYSIKRLS